MKEKGKNTLSHIYLKIICNISVIESSGQKSWGKAWGVVQAM